MAMAFLLQSLLDYSGALIATDRLKNGLVVTHPLSSLHLHAVCHFYFGWNLLFAIFIFIFAPQALMADGFWLFLRGGDDNRYLVDTDS
jgi:hypothetical protein